MSDVMGLDVHDVKVGQQPSFTASGKVEQLTVVTFFVGAHGPFNLSYLPADATPERIKSDIEHRVAQLRQIVSYGQPQMGV